MNSRALSCGRRANAAAGRHSLSHSASSPASAAVDADEERRAGRQRRGAYGLWPELHTRLNRLLLGWAEYFSFGFTGQADTAIRWHVIQRVRQFLCRRHKLRVSGTSRFGYAEVYGKAGVVDLHQVRLRRRPRACPLVKPVREPDARDPQVRFNERRWEAELRPSLRHRHQGESCRK